MLGRRTTGSVVCPSCGSLVGVNDDRCYTCGRSNPGLWGFGPVLRKIGVELGFAELVVGVCSVLYLASLIASGSGLTVVGGAFSFLSPSVKALFTLGASGAAPVFVYGRWWTLLSATWLHGNLLHIVFNMMWVRRLAPEAVDVYGTWRTAIIYVVAGACGFALSSASGFLHLPLIGGAQFTIGASGSILGLLGALVHYGRRGSSAVGAQAMQWAMVLILMGFMMQGVDNMAHIGGFGGGYLASSLLKPMHRERGDHLIIGLALLALSALAVLASIVSTFVG